MVVSPIRPSTTPIIASGTVSQITSVAWGRAPGFTPGKVRELFHPDWVSRDPSAGLLNCGRPTTFEDGFASTLTWYRQAGWL